MSDPRLVLLTGPVGGGKSTVATSLADVLRGEGHVPSVIDLDLVYCMARQSDGFGDEGVWRTARRGAAALADAFFQNGIDVVIVEGSFHDDQECNDVRENLLAEAETTIVALSVSYDETARRVEADPATDRVLSRDPNVLRYLHSQFAKALPFLESCAVVIDADPLTSVDAALAIAERIGGDPR